MSNVNMTIGTSVFCESEDFCVLKSNFIYFTHLLVIETLIKQNSKKLFLNG